MLQNLGTVLELLQRPFNPLLNQMPKALRPFLDFRGRSQRSDFITIIFVSLFLGVIGYFGHKSALDGQNMVIPQEFLMLSGEQSWLQWGLAAGYWLLSIWFVVFLCRRLHDQNLSAILLPLHMAVFWIIGFVDFDGSLILLYIGSFWVILFLGIFRRGTIGPNRFGPDPRGWESVEHFEREQTRLQSGNI